ncbi:STAS domain-containing protein [Oribacterium sinus]|jgi:anti-anti-sigma factor|uniref:Anti-sigma factor antagonist n=1 Tax=Oribacterium sinus TaxID=237576 RepID=A0A930GWR9_9FIRM|nr:STAS domain-containing protein [Oribacterium sinus]MBF1273524.1 STAS domain-containing protein [Oribacterium sinus]
MTVNKKINGGELVLSLHGRLDMTTASTLSEEIKSSIAGIGTLVLDLAGLEYISSAGLKQLLSVQARMNKQGKMLVKNPSAEVREILEITGFLEVLTVE